MVEAEKLQYFLHLVDGLANGVNPVTGAVLSESVFDEPEVIRGLFGVKEILRELLENPKPATRKSASKFVWRDDLPLSEILQDDPICVSPFVAKIKAVNDGIAPSAKAIWELLDAKGILYDGVDVNGEKRRLPTPGAKQYGVFAQERFSSTRGTYTVVTYDRNGQQLLLDCIKEIYGA